MPTTERSRFPDSTDVNSCRPWCAQPTPEGPSSKHDCGHQTSMPVAKSMLSRPLGTRAFQEADGPTDRDLQACVYETATTTLTPSAALD